VVLVLVVTPKAPRNPDAAVEPKDVPIARALVKSVNVLGNQSEAFEALFE
jgi:hypothetical protein